LVRKTINTKHSLAEIGGLNPDPNSESLSRGKKRKKLRKQILQQIFTTERQEIVLATNK
jgi:hypothetical protein